MKIKSILTVSAMMLSLNGNAGLYYVTAHSRANCVGFNESITWHAGHSYWWRVESHHYPPGWTQPHHILNTGKSFTWRAAAYHTNEAWNGSGWEVAGYHFYYPNGQERIDVMTNAKDCNIYDGWWG